MWPDQLDPGDTKLAFHWQLTVTGGTAPHCPSVYIFKLPFLFHAPMMGLWMGSHSYDYSQLKTYKTAILFKKNGRQTQKVNTTHILTPCNGIPGLMIEELKNQYHWL